MNIRHKGIERTFLLLVNETNTGHFPLNQKLQNFRNGDIWWGNFMGKTPENPKIAEFLKLGPFNRKFRKFREKFSKIWVYLARKSSFPKILENDDPFDAWNSGSFARIAPTEVKGHLPMTWEGIFVNLDYCKRAWDLETKLSMFSFARVILESAQISGLACCSMMSPLT